MCLYYSFSTSGIFKINEGMNEQIIVKVAPYCFLKSGKKLQVSTSKVYMDISEKNETKYMPWIIFRVSSYVNR